MRLNKMKTECLEIYLNVGTKEDPNYARIMQYIDPKFKKKYEVGTETEKQ